MTRNFLTFLAAGVALPSLAPVHAQNPAAPRDLPANALASIEAGEGRAVAEKLASELIENYVYADQAKRYAAMLRANAASGRYDSGARHAVAELMSDDLMAMQRDGHLRVSVAEPQAGASADGQRRPPRNWPPLIQSAKWLAPGIAYIRFTAFLSTPDEVAAVRDFMREHSSARTMIFDLRNHHGGALAEMDVIFPYLFAAKTPLVTLEMPRATFDRQGSPFGDAPTLEANKDARYFRATHHALPGQATALRDAKVYLLVSNRTASAGEHFALAFKTTGRATLIGEATAGANHFGGPARLGEHFAAFMPIGRTFDIKTGKDWEGDGVAPDIAVDPRRALIVALEKAGLSLAEAERIDATEIPAEPVHRDKLRAR